MNVKEIRRKNLRILSRSIGGVTQLAERLARSQSQISHLIGTNPVKNIGDKLAAEIERSFDKPGGWLDHEHPGIQEENATYEVSSRKLSYQVPLINWQDIFSWLDPSQKSKYPTQQVITHVSVAEQSFAVRVEGDSMEAAHGASFPEQSIIIVDPELKAYNGAYVLARQTSSSQVIFKQLIIDGHRRYLKPLNPRYPITEINSQVVICGVIRLMFMEFPIK